MMVYCCVPFCKSDSGKVKGVSFHEFPCNRLLTQTWLKVISRDNFTPNLNSRSSVVCSLHFIESDYVQGLKVRRLKKHAVPSAFGKYLAHKVPSINIPKRVIVRKPIHSVGKRKRKCYAIPELHTVITCDRDCIPEASTCRSVEVQTDRDLQPVEAEKQKLRLKLWQANKKIKKLQDCINDMQMKYHSAISEFIRLKESNSSEPRMSNLLDQVNETVSLLKDEAVIHADVKKEPLEDLEKISKEIKTEIDIEEHDILEDNSE